MRLTPASIYGITGVLQEVLINDLFADKAIEKIFKANPHYTSDDRANIAKISYEIIRYWRFIQYVGNSKQDAVWASLNTWAFLQQIQLPAWKEFNPLNPSSIRKLSGEANKIRKLRESVPDWLDELGEQQLGRLWDAELRALNDQPTIFLRANRLKINRDVLREQLRNEGVSSKPLPDIPDALMLDESTNAFRFRQFKEGLFEIQDAGSQTIAPFLQVAPGMRVIDACAGTGGKTLHLAALMKNTGRLIALDTSAWKLDELKKRARRAGVTNLETRLIESGKTIKRMRASADRLLLDVPCSGLGVLKRNPDAKWKLKPEYIEKLIATQQDILQRYSQMIKPGGMLVYATCSILPLENEDQVKNFLQKNAGFQLIEERHLFPSQGFDGFYMARIIRLA